MLPADTIIAGKYRVLRAIGQGGMAIVYEAEHVDVGIHVAIKVLNPDISQNASYLERFRREARAAAAIGHDNIVRVMDYGVFGDRPFMVMEYLQGESLAQRLEREPFLPVEIACAIVGQMLAALTAAARAGIVHRDLKPENVFLISQGGQDDFVKLLDFGISKFASGTVEGERSTATRPGALLGTPCYMSPEQAKAQPNVDARADIYSVGVILYELLTGERPFYADSEAEILAMICYRPTEPRPPSELNPSVSADLDAVVQRAMRYKPEERFQQAAEMLDALRPFAPQALGPVGARTGRFVAVDPAALGATPISWSGRTPTPARRSGAVDTRADDGTWTKASAPKKRNLVMMGAAGIAAVVAISAGALLARHRAAEPAARVPAPAMVRVRLAGLPADSQAALDGVAIHDDSLMVVPGSSHRLTVRAPGRLPFETPLVAREAMTFEIALPAAPPPVAPPVAPATPTVPVQVAAVAPVTTATTATTHPAPSRPATPPPSRNGHGQRVPVVHASTATPSEGHSVHSAGSFVSGTAEY